MSQGNPQKGEVYKHFKNRSYEVIGTAIHSETQEKMVVYQALYGGKEIYVRPYDSFVSEVDHEKYPDVTQKYRFELDGASEEGDVSPVLLKFLDTDDCDEKYKILVANQEVIDDSMISAMAASLDLVIADGSLEERFYQLRNCIKTKNKYESGRLR